MTENNKKKSFWTRIHIDPLFLLCIIALLGYSAFIMWSASGQDPEMMQRKLGQIAMGFMIMIVMAQIPPRVYESWAPHLYFFLRYLAYPCGCFRSN